jgi:hypothetical protein
MIHRGSWSFAPVNFDNQPSTGAAIVPVSL